MKDAMMHFKALPLAAALLLGGCGYSPTEAEPGERDHDTVLIEDEPELEIWLLSHTSPIDSIGTAAPGAALRTSGFSARAR